MQRVEENVYKEKPYFINSELRKIMNLYNKNRKLFNKGAAKEHKTKQK